jgi:putative sterol carrier protein
MSEGAPAGAPDTPVKPRLEEMVAKFNERAKTDDNLRETLKDMERTIQLDVSGEGSYHFFLKDYKIDGVKDGPTNDPQILVATDKVTLVAIMDGELSPTRAYMSKKFKVKATMLDLLVLRKLF